MFMLQELHIYSDRIPDNPHFKQINHQLPKYCTPLHVTHLRCPHPIPTKLATNMSITLTAISYGPYFGSRNQVEKNLHCPGRCLTRVIPIISIESMTVYFFKMSTTKENNRQFPIKVKVLDVMILTTLQKFEMEQRGSSVCQLLYTTNILNSSFRRKKNTYIRVEKTC